MTTSQGPFREKYDVLQSEWRQLAVNRGRPYLQYLPPRERVDFVLVAKMTGISEKEANITPPGEYPNSSLSGFNLLGSMGDLILNYGAHRHLCQPGERYYLTDLGKGAVPAKYAKGKLEREEFDAWYPMLLKELELVSKPCATVVPVSSATASYLRNQADFPYPLAEPVLHFSMAAGVAAKMASSLFPQEWRDFRETTSWRNLYQSIEEIYSGAGLDEQLCDVRRSVEQKFRDIHLHYMFTYKKEMPLRRPDGDAK